LRVGAAREAGKFVRAAERFRRAARPAGMRILLQPQGWNLSPRLIPVPTVFAEDFRVTVNEISIPPEVFPDPEECLAATAFLDAGHLSLKTCVSTLGVLDLTPVERAVRLFEFVRDEILYECLAKIRREEYVASYVLEIGRGFCTQKAVLLAALGRAAGVPTALVLTDLRDESLSERAFRAMGGKNLFEYHGVVAFHIDGRWLKADATQSPDIVQRKGYRRVEFDGRADALLAPETLEGKPHIRYEAVRGVYTDLPFDEMMRLFRAQYSQANLDALAAMQYNL
jgi:hypothetical protein